MFTFIIKKIIIKILNIFITAEPDKRLAGTKDIKKIPELMYHFAVRSNSKIIFFNFKAYYDQIKI